MPRKFRENKIEGKSRKKLKCDKKLSCLFLLRKVEGKKIKLSSNVFSLNFLHIFFKEKWEGKSFCIFGKYQRKKKNDKENYLYVWFTMENTKKNKKIKYS